MFSVPVSAHRLTTWANHYNVNNSNTTYSFAFNNSAHINGNNVRYAWQNTTAKNKFNSSLTNSFEDIWGNMISGTEVSKGNEHVIIEYDPYTTSSNAAARAILIGYDSEQHIVPGEGHAKIIYYQPANTYTETTKTHIAGHELGHLWGITDLYDLQNENNPRNNFNSIYAQPYDIPTATRHDKNALRIGLNDLWYEPVNEEPWWYQPSPGIWIQRGDVDSDGSITASDSRLVIRYSSQLEQLNELQCKVADVNGDSVVNAVDSRLILQYSSQMITTFPAD